MPHPWEPEETVGTLWHRFVTRTPAYATYPEASVRLETVQPRLGLLFRALGGRPGTEIAAAPRTVLKHRRSLWRRIGHEEEVAETPSFDGATLRLPFAIDAFPDPDLNEALYRWLTAWAAFAPLHASPVTNVAAGDAITIRIAHDTSLRVLEACPGLRPVWQELAGALLDKRPQTKLPPPEQAIETLVREALEHTRAIAAGLEGNEPDWAAAAVAQAPNYQTFATVAAWPQLLPAPEFSDRVRSDGTPGHGGRPSAQSKKRMKARRRKSDQAERRDSLILHRFETIKSWAEFMNLNRKAEDDDEQSAGKAAEDANELGLAETSQRPATRLVFDLDLAPQDIDRAALSGSALYPEWDWKSASYLPDHVHVLHSDAPEGDPALLVPKTPAARRRLKAVQRQFEALQPRRIAITRQQDGDEIDLDAALRSVCDLRATGDASDRIYRRTAAVERDLSISTLIDTSRSTESIVGEQQVIDIAREALAALGHGLQATGDAHAIHSFSSLRRDQVFVSRIKDFDEPMGQHVEARIAALKPGFYTRLGAAIRHVSADLARRAATRRLLLVITDGKPNDLDHYEGRHGIEDSRRAVMEARRLGHAVFGITIDKRAEAYIPHIFGQNGFAIIQEPNRLVGALPHIYRQLVT